MKDLEFIIKNHKSECIDSRDISRLAKFLTAEQIKEIGLEFNENFDTASHKPLPFTRENILIQLQKDVEFGFEKALNKRGISSGLMFDVVRMWNWILEEGLENWDVNNYAQYGLPLFKATAQKYGWENPIGDDEGNEFYYSSEYGEE